MMTSDEKTLIPSLIRLIKSDLFTFKNISSSITLEVPNSGMTSNDADVDEEHAQLAKDFMEETSKWEAVISYLPLEFYRIIESIPDMITTEEFNPKYRMNPKLCAYERYGTTNMWRPLMILNKCPRIMDFDGKYMRFYNIELFTNVITILMSRVGKS